MNIFRRLQQFFMMGGKPTGSDRYLPLAVAAVAAAGVDLFGQLGLAPGESREITCRLPTGPLLVRTLRGGLRATIEIDAARLMVLHAAWTIDRHGFAAARDQVSLIKFHVADVMLRVVDRAIQTHGALGITSDTVLAHFYAHERGARIYDGPDEVHKVSVAGRILARYGMSKGKRA